MSRRGARIAQWASIPAPVGGWDTLLPLTAMPANHAIVLDNFTPQPGYVELRRGFIQWATGMGSYPVETLAQWGGPSANKLFAIANGKIYDVTSNASVGAAAVTGLSNSRFHLINVTTAGGAFLLLANGLDTVQKYDGATWGTTAITGPADPTTLISPCLHKSRLWFLQKNSLKAWYLPASAISGAATQFDLGAVVRHGGSLVACGTFTGGQGYGTDDFLTFLTNNGELVVYQGSDVSSSTTWALVGVYRIGAPVGSRPLLKVGPELFVIGMDGILPLSKIIPLDRVNQASASLSAMIQPAITAATSSYATAFGWEACLYPKSNIALVNVPVVDGSQSHQYVVNTITGAWSRWKGINAQTWCLLGNDLFFGDTAGRVCKAEIGIFDDQTPITADLQCAYSDFGAAGRLKQWTMVQPVLTTDGSLMPLIGVDADYASSSLSGSPTFNPGYATLWDQFTWDALPWAGEATIYEPWSGSSSLGRVGAVKLRVTTQPNTGGNYLVWDNGAWDVAAWGGNNPTGANFRVNAFNLLIKAGDGL